MGAQLIFERAVADELAALLGRGRNERTSEAAGSRNGRRPRRVQTTEGAIAMPQVRDTLSRSVSSGIPDTRAIIRTRPLDALGIGRHARGDPEHSGFVLRKGHPSTPAGSVRQSRDVAISGRPAGDPGSIHRSTQSRENSSSRTMAAAPMTPPCSPSVARATVRSRVARGSDRR
jgi:hypothetical protein